MLRRSRAPLHVTTINTWACTHIQWIRGWSIPLFLCRVVLPHLRHILGNRHLPPRARRPIACRSLLCSPVPPAQSRSDYKNCQNFAPLGFVSTCIFRVENFYFRLVLGGAGAVVQVSYSSGRHSNVQPPTLLSCLNVSLGCWSLEGDDRWHCAVVFRLCFHWSVFSTAAYKLFRP